MKRMKRTNENYLTPTIRILVLETEQQICVQSESNGTEDLYDITDGLDDLFN